MNSSHSSAASTASPLIPVQQHDLRAHCPEPVVHQTPGRGRPPPARRHTSAVPHGERAHRGKILHRYIPRQARPWHPPQSPVATDEPCFSPLIPTRHGGLR